MHIGNDAGLNETVVYRIPVYAVGRRYEILCIRILILRLFWTILSVVVIIGKSYYSYVMNGCYTMDQKQGGISIWQTMQPLCNG